MIPVHQRDDRGVCKSVSITRNEEWGVGSLTVIDIVIVRVRIVRVIHNERAAKSVAVLSGEVAMVPVSPGLVRDVEVVEERVARGDRALVHEGCTVSPVGAGLEEAMPVL